MDPITHKIGPQATLGEGSRNWPNWFSPQAIVESARRKQLRGAFKKGANQAKENKSHKAQVDGVALTWAVQPPPKAHRGNAPDGGSCGFGGEDTQKSIHRSLRSKNPCMEGHYSQPRGLARWYFWISSCGD